MKRYSAEAKSNHAEWQKLLKESNLLMKRSQSLTQTLSNMHSKLDDLKKQIQVFLQDEMGRSNQDRKQYASEIKDRTQLENRLVKLAEENARGQDTINEIINRYESVYKKYPLPQVSNVSKEDIKAGPVEQSEARGDNMLKPYFAVSWISDASSEYALSDSLLLEPVIEEKKESEPGERKRRQPMKMESQEDAE